MEVFLLLLDLYLCHFFLVLMYLLCWWRRKGPSYNLWDKHLPIPSLIGMCQGTQTNHFRLVDLTMFNVLLLSPFISARWMNRLMKCWWWRWSCGWIISWGWMMYGLRWRNGGGRMRWRRDALNIVSRCMSEYGISYEGTPCNVEILEMVKDYNFNEGMMK